MKEFVTEFKDGLNKPISRDMPLSKIIMIFILFLVIAFIVFDTLKLIQQWAAQAASQAIG